MDSQLYLQPPKSLEHFPHLKGTYHGGSLSAEIKQGGTGNGLKLQQSLNTSEQSTVMSENTCWILPLSTQADRVVLTRELQTNVHSS
jgi:hypothetical protein